jgi:N-acetylneuraminate synthase
MTYIDYRHRMEFAASSTARSTATARSVGIDWFASCWDEPAVDFIAEFEPPAFKIASASLTDDALLKHTAKVGPRR